MIHIRYNEKTHVELYPVRAYAMGGCLANLKGGLSSTMW